jgi:metallo-beta-lactamase family protein
MEEAMKIYFIGADREVTGSCHYIQACGKNILIDCGMEQGEDVYENQELPINPSDIDYVLLTHAHIDHTGLLPLMYSRGFRGEVYTTKATCDLCDIMLKDSAHIQMFEAEWRNRKAKRSGEPEFVPLYEMKDAIGVLEHFIPCQYEEKVTICDGITVSFTDVGHLLGSASIQMFLEEEGIKKTIVFSGDIGNLNQPLIKNPTYLKEADYVIMESTYGDRSHGEKPDYIGELSKIIQTTFDRGGNVVIPSFAVGRTQEMLYFLRKIKADGLIKGHDGFEVYVDSPLAVEATNIFNKNRYTCFDKEAMELVNQGINPISFPGLKVSVTSEDSKMINFKSAPKVIISASGMCEAGRIKHHLKHNLWRSECTVLFVGYQAIGTLGRKILDGAKEVKLFGETIEIKARIEKLDGISGHADQQGLIRWLKEFDPKPKRVFIVHGEESVCDSFSKLLMEEYGYEVTAPYSGSCYDLVKDCVVKEGEVERKILIRKEPKKVASTVFARLLSAGQRLLNVIKHNEGGANKDLAKFADQINSLCDKWDR